MGKTGIITKSLAWIIVKPLGNALLSRARSKKNGKDKPKIVRQIGKSDKPIRDYLEIYDRFKRF